MLFRHPIESLRTAPAIDQNTLVSLEVLRRLLGTRSNGIVASNPAMVIIAILTPQRLNPIQLIPMVKPVEKPRRPQGVPAWISTR